MIPVISPPRYEWRLTYLKDICILRVVSAKGHISNGGISVEK